MSESMCSVTSSKTRFLSRERRDQQDHQAGRGYHAPHLRISLLARSLIADGLPNPSPPLCLIDSWARNVRSRTAWRLRVAEKPWLPTMPQLGVGLRVKVIKTLQTAVFLGPNHPEGHFNLAIAYEKGYRLREALQEIIVSLHWRRKILMSEMRKESSALNWGTSYARAPNGRTWSKARPPTHLLESIWRF
jgi:hypothetical protein